MVQPSLPGNVSAFLASHEHLIPEGVNHAFQWKDVNKALRGEAELNDWTLLNFYVCQDNSLRTAYIPSTSSE